MVAKSPSRLPQSRSIAARVSGAVVSGPGVSSSTRGWGGVLSRGAFMAGHASSARRPLETRGIMHALGGHPWHAGRAGPGGLAADRVRPGRHPGAAAPGRMGAAGRRRVPPGADRLLGRGVARRGRADRAATILAGLHGPTLDTRGGEQPSAGGADRWGGGGRPPAAPPRRPAAPGGGRLRRGPDDRDGHADRLHPAGAGVAAVADRRLGRGGLRAGRCRRGRPWSSRD